MGTTVLATRLYTLIATSSGWKLGRPLPCVR